MEEKNEMLQLLQKIEASNRKQLLYTRIQCVAAVIAVACFAGIYFLIRDFLPRSALLSQKSPVLWSRWERCCPIWNW